ncbi:MAG: DarT ssDNA thymidine ADP-ribosyltransferase family protein, partial [Anaerolineae bacterium]
TPDGKSLWNFANLYFQPRNPMLYRVIHEKSKEDIVIIGVRSDILNTQDVFISTGNAASFPSEILSASDGLKIISRMWKVINSEWWKEEDGSKRKIMAECLIPDVVAPQFIQTVYVSSHSAANKVKTMLKQSSLPVVPEPHMFFQPRRRISLTNRLSLIEGDMFFSMMHTLAISVNTVGIMGKGLASRAKYQFPDVYVFYQDVCRQRKLKMGKPYLYKREASLDDQLADGPPMLPNANSEKWFLLFPTKKHWRDGSDIKSIEKGLEWVRDNYKTEGVKSLAVPALGCGLGGLEWREVGPIMCAYLSGLEIPVGIYLPREQKLPNELLSKNFLLGRSK